MVVWLLIQGMHVERSDIYRRQDFRHDTVGNLLDARIDTVPNYHVAIKKKSNKGGRGQNGNLHKAANHDCHTTNWCN